MTPLVLLAIVAINRSSAQSVVIGHATPAAVIEHLKTQLLPDSFKVEESNDKGALFTLDRGMVAQQGGRVPFVHVFLELRFRFKQKAEGLAVTAAEEVVGERGRPMEFRRPVESVRERENLQHLLESVRTELQTGSPGDTLAKRDSTHR